MSKNCNILHCDINHCYAQIEEMKHPELKNVPMAVGGHEEERHGIILAKNLKAKKYKLTTGESLREALRKCPQLLIIHPHYEEYIYYTEKVKDIYREYSNQVESFGLDEAWIDVSASTHLYGSGEEIAKIIQRRVLEELGLTISIGVSFNKIFAKFGSDMIKPSGLVLITKENYRELVWPCPIEELFYVGRATKKKMHDLGIFTIKDLAVFDVSIIKRRMGKMGGIIWGFAHGIDSSLVSFQGTFDPVKSVGNSVTTPCDMISFNQTKYVFYVLCESVASRLRDAHLKGSVISISLRNTKLESVTRQRKISRPTYISSEIMETVLALLKENYDFRIPLRSVGVSVSSLIDETQDIQQISLFDSEVERNKNLILDKTMDQIRARYGFNKAKRCSLLMEEKLTAFDPKGDHTIHPVGYF